MRPGAKKRRASVGTLGIYLFLLLLEGLQVLLAAALPLLGVGFVGAAVELAQILVVVQKDLLVLPAQHHQGDGRALVRGPLQMGQGLHKGQAGAYRAKAVFQPLGVALAKEHHHVVDGLLQRLHGPGFGRVPGGEGVHCDLEDLVDGADQDVQLLLGLHGEAMAFLLGTLAQLHQVGGVVADPLKVGGGLQKHIHLQVLVLLLYHLAQADQEAVRSVGELVQAVLFLQDLGHVLLPVVQQLLTAPGKVVRGHLAHGGDGLGGLAHGDGRGDVELLIQGVQLRVALGLFLVLRDHPQRQLHQRVGEGDQQHGGQQVEHGLEVGDDAAVGGLLPELRAPYTVGLEDAHDHHEHHRADGVAGDIRHAHPAGVLVLIADGADHGGGDAGAQVDAHDHRVGHGEGDPRPAGGGGGLGHGLQHAHGGRGALNDHGQHQAEEDAKERVGQEVQEHLEHGGAYQRLHAGGHQIQAGEQDAEADADVANGLGGLLLHEHQQNDAHQQGQRRQGVGVKEPQEPVVPGVDGAQADDLGGDGGADVGAHGDRHGLLQVQHTGAYQGHGEHDRSRGALDHRRDQRAGDHAHDHIAGDLFQHPLQRGAGAVLQAIAHQVDAVKEHGQTAQQHDHRAGYVHNTHLLSSISGSAGHEGAAKNTAGLPGWKSCQKTTGRTAARRPDPDRIVANK